MIDFNVCIGLVIFEGIISTLLSFSSKWSGTMDTNKDNISKKKRAQRQSNQSKKDQAKSFKSTTLKSKKLTPQKQNKVKLSQNIEINPKLPILITPALPLGYPKMYPWAPQKQN